MKVKDIIAAFVSFFATVATEILGGWDLALKVLVFVIVVDMITGILKGIVNKELSSQICLKGCVKKICYLLLVGLGVALDKLLNTDGIIRLLIIYFFVSTDAISILENVGEMGVPYPKFLKDLLAQLNEKTNEGEIPSKTELNEFIKEVETSEAEEEEIEIDEGEEEDDIQG